MEGPIRFLAHMIGVSTEKVDILPDNNVGYSTITRYKSLSTANANKSVSIKVLGENVKILLPKRKKREI